MNQMSWSSEMKSRIRCRHGAADFGAPRARPRARLALAVALALGCVTCGKSPTVSGQAAPAPAAAPAVGAAALADSHVQLAQKLVESAEQILHNGIPGVHQWQQGAALLEAACTLDPAEPSYPRLLAETWRELGDNDQVIAALNKYRAAAKAANWPDDQVAQVELIDRYLIKIETVDQRIKYLRDMLAMPSLAPEVKAHAAVQCVPLLAERSNAEAEAMIGQAIRLDPLNLVARRMQYRLVAQQGSPLERIQVLLAIIRSNPTQRDALEELARQLGEAGLAQPALDWYSRLLLVDQQAGAKPELATLLDDAAQCYVAGQFADADVLVNQVIDASPRDPDAWYMRLAFDRTNPDRQAAYAQELEIAKRVFVAQAANIAKKIIGPVQVPGASGTGANPATQPATGPAADPAAGADLDIPEIKNDDLRGLVARIRAGQAPPGMAEAFTSAISDMAWFHLYFQNAPLEGAPWVAVLKAIVPPDDVRAVRLQGWLDLTSGRSAQAQAALSRIQDIDPLAAIGIIRMTAQGQIRPPQAPAQAAPGTRPAGFPAAAPGAAKTPAVAPATARTRAPASAPEQKPVEAALSEETKNFERANGLARQLMSRSRVGLPAAVVYAEYRDRKLQPDPRPDGVAIRGEILRFPAQWVHIIERPEQFYLIIGTPLKLPHKLGEPMLATITVSNISPYDITVGPDGVVSPDLFFDTWLGIRGTKKFPHAAYDRIANVLVLPAGTQTTQIVRLDQGPITEALREKPSSDVVMYAKVTTNPTARGSEIVPGPAGIRRDFQKQFVRKSSAMNDNIEEQKVMGGLNGLPSERMATLDALQAHILAARDPGADGRALALAQELNDAINTARNDPTPDVSAWATYLAMQLAKPEDKPQLAATLAASHDWEIRLLAGLAAIDLPPKTRRPIADQLAHDTLPEISLFGSALAADLDNPTSRPAMDAASSRNVSGGPPALPAGPALQPATQP